MEPFVEVNCIKNEEDTLRKYAVSDVREDLGTAIFVTVIAHDSKAEWLPGEVDEVEQPLTYKLLTGADKSAAIEAVANALDERGDLPRGVNYKTDLARTEEFLRKAAAQIRQAEADPAFMGDGEEDWDEESFQNLAQNQERLGRFKAEVARVQERRDELEFLVEQTYSSK